MPISGQSVTLVGIMGHAAKRKALRICSSFPPTATSTVAIRNVRFAQISLKKSASVRFGWKRAGLEMR
jgi:hypothetical protein